MEKVVMPTPPPPPSALCCPLKSKPCCCYSEEETCRQMALDCFCSAFEQLFETINSSSISSEIIDFADNFWPTTLLLSHLLHKTTNNDLLCFAVFDFVSQ